MTAGEIHVEPTDDTVLVGIDAEGVSLSACVEIDAEHDDVEDAIDSLQVELHHYASIVGRRSA